MVYILELIITLLVQDLIIMAFQEVNLKWEILFIYAGTISQMEYM